MRNPADINILVACEESQRICIAFRERGFNAYSCDIQEESGGHPEWHIMGDCLPLLNGNCTFTTRGNTTKSIKGQWDLIIAHPPCTYLSNAGASRLYKIISGETFICRDRFEKGWEAREFLMKFLNADCECIAVENPTPSRCFHLPTYSQVIQPYMFGDPYTKRTCLWIKGLPQLRATQEVEPIGSWVQGNGEAWKKKRARGERVIGGHKSPKIRSKTFPGIAQAIAKQWGDFLLDE